MISNTQIFRNYWQHKGMEFGTCHTSPESPWVWINIPKNASSFTQTLFAHQLLWSNYNYFDFDMSSKTPIVVLRDPVERWISGIAEYINLYHENFDWTKVDNQMFDWIFDRVSFDDHTESQVYFLQGLDLQKTVWFKCDNNYENKLIMWMEAVGLVQHGFKVPDCVREFEYLTSSDAHKQKTKDFFNRAVVSNPGYLRKLKEYFKRDYDLIGMVNFQ
jgi:hypothetical protein